MSWLFMHLDPIRYHLLGHAVDIRKRQLYTVPTRKLHDHLGVI